MSLLELLVLLVIAGIAGAIAEFLVGFSPGGFLVSIIIGAVGAFIGTWLARQLGLPPLLTITINENTLSANAPCRSPARSACWRSSNS